MAYTARQLQILNQLGRNMGFAVDEITAVDYVSDIPVSVTYRNGNGTFTRQTYDQLGPILNSNERSAIRQNNFSNQSLLTTAFGATSALTGINTGFNPRSSDFAYSSGRISATSALTGLTRNFDPKAARLVAAGLGFGFGDSQLTNTSGQVVSFANNNQEDRVRISDPSGIFINASNAPLAPLAQVGFVLFPYTPTITVNHQANYQTENLTHTNYGYPFYQNSPTANISITGTFTAKDPVDAAYVLAVQHFFRSVTKMFYGKDPEAGTPPPVLRLDGHGDYQFSSVPIVITEFNINLPNDVDYITTSGDVAFDQPAGNYAPGSMSAARAIDRASVPGYTSATKSVTSRVPVMQEFQITCMPLYSRKSISNDFGLRDFAAGKLLGVRGGRGGFI